MIADIIDILNLTIILIKSINIVLLLHNVLKLYHYLQILENKKYRSL